MKTLNYTPELAQMILDDKKRTTRRINDEKEIQPGDDFEFTYKPIPNGDKVPFAHAHINEVYVTTFEALNDKDRDGHEGFENDAAMYAWYSNAYNLPCTPQTDLKIIKFTVTKKLPVVISVGK